MSRIAVTLGDPAGIGPEVCLKAMAHPRMASASDLALVGGRAVLERCAGALSLPMVAKDRLVDVPVDGATEVAPGKVSEVAGRASVAYIEAACDLAKAGEAHAIVTAPVNKEALRAAGCPHIGHTELLAALFGVADPLTMFVTGRLRVFFLTRHLSLRQAIDAVKRAKVLASLEAVDAAMRDLGFARPSIAVAALNPHAGDGGQFGDEEVSELGPAADDARRLGIDVHGPIPADSVFHQALEGEWDCVLSLYHDQGHIATKTRDFHGTVTATLGLPVLRTSVDHGTAFDIAWRGVASEESLVSAVLLARELLALARASG